MTRINFRLPQAQPLDAEQSQRLQDSGRVKASPGMALMLNSDKTGAAAISGTVRLVQQSQLKRNDPQGYDQQVRARQILRELASGLVDESGKVHSGYMSLSADGQTLSNTSRWSSGNRSGAVDQIRQLVNEAYGHRMADLGMKDSLDSAIDAYLSRSGGRLGTRSLVALVKDLEQRFGQDGEQASLPQVKLKQQKQTDALKSAQVGKARLNMGSVQAQAMPKNPEAAIQKLFTLYQAQDEQLLQAEKAAIAREYPWADGGQVGDRPISHGHEDYRITGFTDFKVMERLAQERGMPPQDFMTLLKRQGPEVLIDPAGSEHPAGLGKQLHRDLVAAFHTASSLDEFHNAVSELGLKTLEALRTERADQAALMVLPTFPPDSLEHSATQALEDLGAGLEPLRPQAPSPQGPVDWPDFAMPRWEDQEIDPAAQALYRWGAGLLMSALHEQQRSDDLGPLSDLLQSAAEQALDGEAAILLSEEVDQLIGEVPANSALAFGRDCLRESLGWLPSHTLPYRPENAPADHPLTQLRRHPFLQAAEPLRSKP